MNADDWRRLGKALQSNAELLQELAQSDEQGVCIFRPIVTAHSV